MKRYRVQFNTMKENIIFELFSDYTHDELLKKYAVQMKTDNGIEMHLPDQKTYVWINVYTLISITVEDLTDNFSFKA